MDYTKYENKLTWPTRQTHPDPEARKKAAEEYWKENSRLRNLFKADALLDVGLDTHPKADKIFQYAWDQGHSCGYSEVYGVLGDLADMLA